MSEQIGPHSFDGAHLGVDRVDRSIDRLVESVREDARTRHISGAPLPHRRDVLEIVDRLVWLMFPGFVGPRDIDEHSLRDHIASTMREVSRRLTTQVIAAIRYTREVDVRDESHETTADCEKDAAEIIIEYLDRLHEIRRLLSLDVQAAYDGDPAAVHTDEVIFSYPGTFAITIHRLAHELLRLGVPLLPRIMSEYAHSRTGVDIHPEAKLGKSFFIDHGTGVVIGATSVIGDHCKIYQGVTLGAKSFPKDERGRLRRDTKRHPTLEDHVTVYAGATILGGDTVIGANSVVNGGVFLTHSVPPGTIVRAPKIEVRTRSNPITPPANYSI